MQNIRNLPDSELESEFNDIDWDKLSKMHVSNRSGIDCKLRWISHDSPSINKSNWTKEEDKLLVSLSRKHRGHNWNFISNELNSKRTSIQCFKRYQRSLNTSMVKSKWKEEEDKILMEAVKCYGEKNWQQGKIFINLFLSFNILFSRKFFRRKNRTTMFT
jgi:hypothetical protein